MTEPRPQIGETRPAGWFVDRTHYQTPKPCWRLTDFRRCWTSGPHDPTSSHRWKPVWKYHA